MTYALVTSGAPAEITQLDIFAGTDQFSYATMLEWSDQERVARGIYPITDDAIPAGKVPTGSSLSFAGGVVKRSFTLADIPPPTQSDLLARAASQRWDREVGGITFSGVPIATDDRSKLMVTGARVAADADPEWMTMWQGADNHVYPLDAATMIAVSNAVSAHVAGCFSIYAVVKAQIEAGTITTMAAVDEAFA